MKKITPIAIIISLAMALVAYLATNNYIIAAAISFIFLLYYFILGMKKLKLFINKINRIDTCYHFINSFIITMSITNSINESYNNAIQGKEGDFKAITGELTSLNTDEKLIYLRKHFNLAIYKIFLNILKLYEDQGGNILDMSDSLMAETMRIKDSLTKTLRLIKKNLIEFVILWIISLGVLLFMRFGISSFYLMMIKSYMFVGLLMGFFLLVLISIHIAISRATTLIIKEDKV